MSQLANIFGFPYGVCRLELYQITWTRLVNFTMRIFKDMKVIRFPCPYLPPIFILFCRREF